MLAIELEFLMGRMVATDIHERNRPEWPPHPQRLLSALLAAQSELELGEPGRAALEWLESLPAPEIKADLSPSLRQVHSHWVPVNDEVIKVDKRRLDFRHLVDRRNRQERFFPAVTPVDPVVVFQWPEALGLEDHRNVLSKMVENLTYFGHSSSPVRACLLPNSVEPTLVPSHDGNIILRVPGPGRLGRLRTVHQLRQTNESVQPPVGRLQQYTDGEVSPHTVFSPQAVVLAFDDGPRLSLDSTLPLMLHLRRALLARFQSPAPVELSGHEENGAPATIPHLAFAPLSYVDSKFADGSMKGAVLLLPRNTEQSIRRRLVAKLNTRWELRLGPLGAIQIRLVNTPEGELKSLRFDEYAALHDIWATVTPLILDRHPKKSGLDSLRIITESCLRIGLPAPAEVHLSSTSAVTGAPRAGDFHGHSKQIQGRMRTHALLRFPTQVQGPLLLGAGRFIGLGLCLPLRRGRI